jgi:hypothetical protein
MGARVEWVSVLALALGIFPHSCRATAGSSVFTVGDAIDTARFQYSENMQSVFPSPDRRRYAVMVVRGDLARNGVWAEILVGSLKEGSREPPTAVARLFTTALNRNDGAPVALVSASDLIAPVRNVPAWLNNDEIALLWQDANQHTQIFSIDANGTGTRQLTSESGDLVGFAVGPGGSILYEVNPPLNNDVSLRLIHEGFAVNSEDALMMLAGIVDGRTMMDLRTCHRMAMIPANGSYQVVTINGGELFCESSYLALRAGKTRGTFSPDGRQAIISTQIEDIPDDWSRYGGRLTEFLRQFRSNPHGLLGKVLTRSLVVDVHSGRTHPLWSVPNSPIPRSEITWSPTGTSVLIAPTFLPATVTDVPGLTGHAVAEVDTKTGEYIRIPVAPGDALKIVSADWVDENRVSVQMSDKTSEQFKRGVDGWRRVQTPMKAPDSISPSASSVFRVEVRQGLNEPPTLHAMNMRSGEDRIIVDPNPGLDGNFALGRVEMAHWTDRNGNKWTGRLYYPANYVLGRRYPLIVQTYGYAAEKEYSIYGRGGTSIALGPSWSVFLAQPMASRGIAVLQIGGPDLPGVYGDSDYDRVRLLAQVIPDAVYHLGSMGLVDLSRVGLMGHSATGRLVEQSLADSDFDYAAAIAVDYADANYVQAALSGWAHLPGQPPPFGPNLKPWLSESPAFNVERIRTPLQIDLTSGGQGLGTVLWSWEMYSRLKKLHKPVEYYLMPDISRGAHTVQNPSQLFTLQNRALDWWLFWLKDEEDPEPRKQEQYREWRLLREQHIEDMAHRGQ